MLEETSQPQEKKDTQEWVLTTGYNDFIPEEIKLT